MDSADRDERFLIVGLGNPGRNHAFNRHNVGFMAVDKLALAQGIDLRRVQSKAIVGNGRLAERAVILAKPQTFMNLSGEAVGALASFYRIPPRAVLVVYDELDIPFGVIRLREKGGAGGHNGMRSIIGQLGTNQFARLRVGIGRPPGRMDPAAFVLQDFNRDEALELPGVLDRAVKAVETFVVDNITTAMNQFNSSQLGGQKDL